MKCVPIDFYTRAKPLIESGLYDPAFEHDACGVGLVASINGIPSRGIVEAAIEGLKCVYHRGAVDADGKTGDGAGIRLQIPYTFFGEEKGIAVGMMFLPRKNMAAQDACRLIVEQEISREGYRLKGWRQVPVNSAIIGEVANDTRPEIEQIIILPKAGEAEDVFERNLYVIRKRIEKAARARAIAEFYIASLSCRSLVYKGLFKAEQLTAFYPDLLDEKFVSAYALFHQRFSTNTAPAWHLAQPFRVIAHNGEINTLKGNVNFMKSHEATFSCEAYAGVVEDIVPVIPDNTSDTGALDAVFEVQMRAGRALPLAKLILIPPAWTLMNDVPAAHQAMYSCLNSTSEPWDGPAALVAADGDWVMAGMDRNGLRPLRYTITREGTLVVASESGMVPVHDADVAERGRLGPGDVLGLNLKEGKLYRDRELKDLLAGEQPYGEWTKSIVKLGEIPASPESRIPNSDIVRIAAACGHTFEEVETIVMPMARDGKEAIGSMGDDGPLAVLDKGFRPLSHYFRQNFSQVTNPPIDPLRERRVMSLNTRFGNDGNYLQLDHSHATILLSETPVLLSHEVDAITSYFKDKITTIDCTYSCHPALVAGSGQKNPDPAIRRDDNLQLALKSLVAQAEAAARSGKSYIVMTDEARSSERVGIPMILAVSAVHSHLVKHKLRKKASLIVRTAECLEPHCLAVLVGAGATVVNPYLAEALIARESRITSHDLLENYRKAMGAGLLKIMSKMGISVVSSYRGGLNFEAIGLSRALVAEYFPGLPSRISGIGLHALAKQYESLHRTAYHKGVSELKLGGFYRKRAREGAHAWEGEMVHLLQTAVGKGSYQVYKKFSEAVAANEAIHVRDLLAFKGGRAPVAIEQVESITEIRRRFVAPAMSLGALSPEAHQTLAIAMNRIGAGSNSGEGGEGSERYQPLPNGDNANSTIKQVASARFGVTAEYLNSASEIQIKVAQGAKPGEGGQLPGFKVTAEIARLRHATEGVMLISPPPHHDIYSIEDLAQLIYDLKQINPRAIVSVKLVAQSGIGTIASGVAKAMADKIIIAGHNGGTGASPWSSVKFAGIPWEIGLAEANQVLTLNRLRHRVKLQTDGGLKTGRDIVIAAMLGAEEYAIGTAALVAMGCLMVRQCHSNTCPVGITTQDPKLRAKFDGSVDKVINLMSFVAEEVREILAQLGFTKLDEIVGRADLLTQVEQESNGLDLNNLLALADAGNNPRIFSLSGRNEVPDTLDAQMIKDAEGALTRGEKIQLAYTVKNTMRAVGSRLSSVILWHGSAVSTGSRAIQGDPAQPLGVSQDDSITIRLRGSAGQSLGAFLTRGIKIELYGDANDYVGKGLSGGTIAVRPRPSSALIPHENTIIGNTVLYGATSGKLFASGQAGERFAVRNSGAEVVVEGCGSNGCEYMTGGVAVILGDVGTNFAAGMTGGMAFVYDTSNTFASHVNEETVVFQPLASSHWEGVLKAAIEEHARETASMRAAAILADWEHERRKFVQVCPKEMVSRLAFPLMSSPESRQAILG
jgi:glutamate synthase (NADPH) large chain